MPILYLNNISSYEPFTLSLIRNPPEWYFRSLHECELNPQYYR